MPSPPNAHHQLPPSHPNHPATRVPIPPAEEDVFSSGFFPIATPEILGIGGQVLQAQNIAIMMMLQEIRQKAVINILAQAREASQTEIGDDDTEDKTKDKVKEKPIVAKSKEEEATTRKEVLYKSKGQNESPSEHYMSFSDTNQKTEPIMSPAPTREPKQTQPSVTVISKMT